MLVHFLGGLSLSYLCRLFGFSFLDALILVTIVLIGWEVYEKLAHIAEPWTNTILDLIVGVVGIWLAYKIVVFSDLGANILVVSVLLMSWIGLNFWGWLAWREREELTATVPVAEMDSTTIHTS